jgi:hypothetical protein
LLIIDKTYIMSIVTLCRKLRQLSKLEAPQGKGVEDDDDGSEAKTPGQEQAGGPCLSPVGEKVRKK